MDWYIVRTRSEKEDLIRAAMESRIRAAGAEPLFGRILIPTERLSEVRDGKKRISEVKIFPGYLLVEMEFTDQSWFLVTETPGISGFVGDKRHPQPMEPQEIQGILDSMENRKEKPKPKLAFEVGDKVKVKEGPFENYEGEVLEVNPEKGFLTVQVNIFRRSTPVELEFWMVERL